MIGVFDSGVGGLLTVAALRRRLPQIDILYFGDTAHMPYGEKSDCEIVALATHAADLLLSYGAERLIAACGTVSAVALPIMQDLFGFPVDGVTDAAAEEAAGAKRIAVLGTEATVRSDAFTRLLATRSPTAEIRALACPLFVTMAENGRTDPQDPAVMRATRETLAPLLSFCPDCVILGCTHFPLLSRAIASVFPDARLIPSGEAAARRLSASIPNVGTGKTHILVSGDANLFREAANRFFGNAYRISVDTIHDWRDFLHNNH